MRTLHAASLPPYRSLRQQTVPLRGTSEAEGVDENGKGNLTLKTLKTLRTLKTTEISKH